MSKSNSSKNILFLMTGSIACYKACNVLSKLNQNGFHVKTVMSPSALEFVGASTVEGLTGEAPITDMYAAGNVMDHINLMRWADLIIAAPATANFINKIAGGLGDDLLTTLFLAHDFAKPFLIAPAMNTKMYLHPATQESIQKLKKMNVEILETASGVLACGEIGSGRLLEPDLIYSEITSHFAEIPKQSSAAIKTTSIEIATTTFKNQPYGDLKVLVTGGGTSEAIDDVRFITNKSTGKTAASIADYFAQIGAQVTYLHADTAVKPTVVMNKRSFVSFNDLFQLLKEETAQNKYDLIIHCAAVSDYGVVPFDGKLASEADEVTLKLKRNPKIIDQIKTWSRGSKLIGFKLTSTADEKIIREKVAKLFETAGCDLVIQNDWNDIQNNKHVFHVFSKDLQKIDQAESGIELSQKILNLYLNLNRETKL